MWERAGLALVLLVAGVLDFWQLNRVGYGNTYYAAAVKSMLQNWHNFFFNAFDPGGFVTIDKPPLGFWLQVASAKIFGFSGLSLMLPQALAGVLSVAVLYRLVSRSFGTVAGLLAALALAVMPVSVAASRNNIIDGTLVLVTLLGAWAVLRAAETGRLRWLLLCAVLVGLGFNVKMLEAYLVVPAFGLLYLVAAPRRWTTRTWHLGLATAVLLAVSFSWALAVDLTPASARPYVGSSGTNSEVNLALGYNGLERLTGRLRLFTGGRRPTLPSASAAPGTHAAASANSAGPAGGTGNAAQQAAARGFTRGETGNPGPLRLFNSALGSQVSWLLPLALLGLIAAAWRTRVRFPLDRRQQSLVLWGAWLLVQAAFFSIAGFFHTYYMVMMAPSIAALAGIGLVALWRDYRSSSWRGWALPLTLLVTAGVQAYLLSSYPGWSSWLTPLVVGFCVVAAIALGARRLDGRVSRRVALGAAALGVVGLLAAPTTWAADTVLNTRGGGLPTAGPPPQNGGDRFPGAARAQSGRRGFVAFDGRGFAVFGGFGGRDDAGASTRLVQYLEAHRGQTRYLLATLNAMTAAPIILATGQPVMALGGFSGADRIVTPRDLSRLVSDGTVRFFLLNSFSPRAVNLDALPPQIRAFVEGRGGRGFGGFGGGQNGDLVQWVSANCAVVPSSLWQPTATRFPGGAGSPSTGARGSRAGGFGFFGPGGGGEQLYDCARRPSRVRSRPARR
jgi:4-amino-4-deoxy-L-arabinose transferase-like glycosyltransferase